MSGVECKQLARSVGAPRHRRSHTTGPGGKKQLIIATAGSNPEADFGVGPPRVCGTGAALLTALS